MNPKQENPFKIGDVVSLNSDRHRMTVIELDDNDYVTVVWLTEKKELDSGRFPVVALGKYGNGEMPIVG